MPLERVEWTKGREDDFKSWFHEELANSIGDRTALEQKWDDALVQWRATVPTGTKEFPWPGASNIEVPLTGMHVDPVYSDMMQSFHASEDYWTPVARRADRVREINSLREGLTALDRSFLRMREVNRRAFQDQIVLGTSIYKTHWLRRRVQRPHYDFASGSVLKVPRFESFPRIEHIPLQDFYIPPYAWNIDPDAPVGGAPWVSQRFFITYNELNTRKSEDPSLPGYSPDAVDRVLQYERSVEDRIRDRIFSEDEYTPFRNQKIDLHEVYVRFPAGSENIDCDLQIIWHQPTSEILRAVYHPFEHGKRPFQKTVYFPYLGFYGIGMAELDEWAQLTITKLVNAHIDNVMLVNTRMYGVPLGAGFQPGEPIYPGKIWPLGPQELIQEIRLGDVYPSLSQVIGQFFQWGELRTGVSELRQGNISGLPSRTPATTILSLLREGNKRFDLIHSDTRLVHSEMGRQVVLLLAQQLREEPERWFEYFRSALGDEDAANIATVLSNPDEFDNTFGISVSATSAQVNKEVEKQSFIGLLQLVVQYYGQLTQTAMMMQQMPPGTIPYETASASYRAGVQLIARLLERFDIQNPSEYLGNMEAIAASLAGSSQGMNPASMAMMGGMGVAPPGLGGGAPGAPLPPPGFPDPSQLGGLFGGF